MDPRTTSAQRREGQTIGKYQIGQILGIGGMSTVYAATHRNGLAVAVKVLHDELASDERTRRWFLREAYLANQVNHPGAVSVLDDDLTADGAAYLVIERLYGDTLRAIAEAAGRRLPPEAVSIVGYEVLDVLAAAHARRIIHRDVKPENIFLTDDGDVKVLDFGIAHPLPVIGESSALATMRLAGTPAFMAPEQARGAAPRPESDLWAVGATMFALITGEHVHSEAPPHELLLWAANRPARRIRDVVRDVPEALATLIDRALAFDPDERFAGASAMRASLEEAFATSFQRPLNNQRAPLIAHLRGRDLVLGRSEPPVGVHSAVTHPPPESHLTSAPGILTHTPRHEKAPPTQLARFFSRRRIAAAGVTLTAIVAAISLLLARTKTAASGSPQPTQADREFEVAYLAWQDASLGAAEDHLSATLSTDPQHADAYLLRVIMSNWNDSSVREDYRHAVEARSRLSDTHRRLLDAIAPAMSEEVGIQEISARIDGLASSDPDDAFVSYVQIMNFIKLGELPGALNAIERLPPSLAGMNIFTMLRGLAHSLSDDLEAARADYERCAKSAANATTCLASLVAIDTYEGQCERAEKIARHMVALNPDSASSLRLLGRAVFASHRDLDASRHVYEQRWEHLQSYDASGVAAERAKLHVLEGAFDAANLDLSVWRESLRTNVDEEAHADYAEFAALLALERGDAEKAAQAALDFASERTGLIGGSYFDFGILPLRILHLAHRVADADFLFKRDQWLQSDFAHGPRVGAPAIRWLRAYGQTANTTSEAEDALRVLPQYGVQPRSHRPADQDYALGHTYLLAGHTDEALKHLHRGAASCSGTDWPFQQTWVYFDLGRAFEIRNQTTEGCTAYARVLARWGAAIDSVTAQMARARANALRCPQQQ